MSRTIKHRRIDLDDIEDPAEDSSGRIVAASESSAGMISYDDLGQARWTWVTEIAGDSARIVKEDTFDYLKALTNDGLELADEPGANVPGDPVGGYDPYDTARIKIKGKLPRR